VKGITEYCRDYTQYKTWDKKKETQLGIEEHEGNQIFVCAVKTIAAGEYLLVN
jgi:hypothetical protein